MIRGISNGQLGMKAGWSIYGAPPTAFSRFAAVVIWSISSITTYEHQSDNYVTGRRSNKGTVHIGSCGRVEGEVRARRR